MLVKLVTNPGMYLEIGDRLVFEVVGVGWVTPGPPLHLSDV